MPPRSSLTFAALAALSAVVERMDGLTLARWGNALGWGLHRWLPARRIEADRNLRRAFPGRSAEFYRDTLAALYRNYTIIFLDALRAPRFAREGGIETTTRNILDEAVAENKGVLFLTGHVGNWEMIPAWMSRHGYRFVPVVKRQANRGADCFFLDLRSRTGTAPIYSHSPISEMISQLRAGVILGLASDQNAGRHGEFLPFFGHPASTPRGAAVFHLRTGAPLVFGWCVRDPRGLYRLNFERITPVEGATARSITALFLGRLEEIVRQYPDQYFWFHRRWRIRPPRASATAIAPQQ